MSGPETHLYNALPTPSSIRVLQLAPGELEDGIACYLFPCDLDKDPKINPDLPQAFRDICMGTAEQLDDTGISRQWLMHLDSYIDENFARATSEPCGQGLSTVEEQPDFGHVEQLSGITGASVAGSGTDVNAEILDILGQFQELASEVLAMPDIDRKCGTMHLDSDSMLKGLAWDLLQQTKIARAEGVLDDRVRPHPFQSYTALSYVWGDLEDPAHITLDGQPKFQITRNLFDALRSLRKPDMAVALWVDAICINQDDAGEKSAQIQLMRRVYSQARSVIAYVPQMLEDAESFNELLNKIVQAGMKCRQTSNVAIGQRQREGKEPSNERHKHKCQQRQKFVDLLPDSSEVHVEILPSNIAGACLEDYGLPPEEDPVWSSWRRFFASPYFRRVWVLQEYASSRNITYHNGHSQEPFSVVLHAMQYIASMSKMLNARYLSFEKDADLSQAAALGWRGLETMYIEFIQTGDTDIDKASRRNTFRTDLLINKLQNTFEFNATDLRDKVYALLGLASDAAHFTPLISYRPEDTPPKVYESFAKALIERGHLIEVIHMACLAQSTLQLPSWVPDWSAPSMSMMTPIATSKRKFQAGGSELPARACFAQNALILTGRKFARIGFKASISQTSGFDVKGTVYDTSEKIATALEELVGHLEGVPKEILLNAFYCLTVQPETFDTMGLDISMRSKLHEEWTSFRALFEPVSVYSSGVDHVNVHMSWFSDDQIAILQQVFLSVTGRCFGVTDVEKQICLMPEGARLGDCLVIVQGLSVPLVIREITGLAVEEAKKYTIIGDAYVLGAMQGQHTRKSGFEWGRLTIV